MTQKEIVRQFNDNLFSNNDKAFAVLAEHATMQWPGWGQQPLQGRDAIRNFLETSGPDAMIEMHLESLVEEGNEVIGHGSCVTVKDGKEERNFFADCYTFKDGQIASVISYMVMEQK